LRLSVSAVHFFYKQQQQKTDSPPKRGDAEVIFVSFLCASPSLRFISFINNNSKKLIHRKGMETLRLFSCLFSLRLSGSFLFQTTTAKN